MGFDRLGAKTRDSKSTKDFCRTWMYRVSSWRQRNITHFMMNKNNCGINNMAKYVMEDPPYADQRTLLS